MSTVFLSYNYVLYLILKLYIHICIFICDPILVRYICISTDTHIHTEKIWKNIYQNGKNTLPVAGRSMSKFQFIHLTFLNFPKFLG